MQRTLYIAASFAIVVVAYWCYALMAVPFIEPSSAMAKKAAGSDEGGVKIGSQSRRRQAELREVFPPGSWELDGAKILQSDQFKMMFLDYENQGNGMVKLTPCTMVFRPAGEDADDDNERAPIIVQAPQGALLKFDKALDLKMAKIGKPIGGRLLGRVTVFSYGSKPGDEDDFIFVTDDLSISKSEIHTSHKVQFRFGPHYGSGQDMRIKLAQTKGPAESKPGKGPKVGGILSVEIKHLKELHLEIPAADDQVAATDRNKQGTKPATLAKNKKAGPEKATLKKTVPIEVHCEGPFRIDLVDNVITFEDHVDVMRFYPKGQSDQINCELLSVYLAQKTTGKKTSAKNPAAKQSKKQKKDKPGLDDLEPRRIVALGNPVVVHAPQHDVEACGRRLEYDMQSERILLDGRSQRAAIAAALKKAGAGSLAGLRSANNNIADEAAEAFLKQGPNEIHAVYLQYEPAEDQRQIGKLVAQGPGWLRGEMDGKAGDIGASPPQTPAKTDKKREPQILEASWQGLLRLRPDDQYKSVSPKDKFHTISLAGDAILTFPGMGRLMADEIHFWMVEPSKETQAAQPKVVRNKDGKKPEQLKLKPHSMLACGKQKGTANPAEMNKVKINSPRLTGVVERLQVWFEEDPTTGKYQTRVETEPVKQVPYKRAQTSPLKHTAFYQPNTDPHVTGPTAATPAPTDEPQNHFHVVGKLLKVSVTLGEDTELSKLTVSGNVRLEETKTAKPEDEPIVIEGDQIVVRNASRPHATVIVTGTPAKPATFQGQGLTLSGANINLNRGTNRLWMDCPGTMTLPQMKKGTQGGPFAAGTASSSKATIPAGPMTVHWQHGMEFDGRTITFEQSVLATSRERILRTETLKVSLDRMVSFDQTSGVKRGKDEQPGVQLVRCEGGVVMQSRTFDEQNMLTSTESMTAVNLTINNASGDIFAAGPGVVTTVRLGGTDTGAFADLSGRPREVPVAPRVAGPNQNPRPNQNSSPKDGGRDSGKDADEQGLTYLNVTFQGSLTGNTERRKINFIDDVKAVYGPVETWEQRLPDDNPDGVGPDGAILSCQQLSVTSMQTPNSKQPNSKQQSIELEATGNMLIEGMLFSARGARMSFNQAKDLMILEGYGRNPATLYYQEVSGGEEQKLHAKRIMYWPKTKATSIDGAQSMEFFLDKPLR